MKNLIILISLVFVAQNAFALNVVDSFHDVDTHEIVMNVTYSGGCGDHKFDLQFSRFCSKSFPAQSRAKLTHTTDDKCEALLSKEIRFPAEKFNCDVGYLKIENGHRELTQVFIRGNSRLK